MLLLKNNYILGHFRTGLFQMTKVYWQIERNDSIKSHELEGIYQVALPFELKHAVEKRKCDYLLGRLCAEAAISALTGEKGVILDFSKTGAPKWPKGVVGSISHNSNLVLSVCALKSNCVGIGIDCEEVLINSTFKDIKSIFISADEEQFLNSFGKPLNLLGTLLFSFKEATFKALFPLVNSYFDFKDFSVTNIDFEEKTIQGYITKNISDIIKTGFEVQGHFSIDNKNIIVGVECMGI